MFHRSGVEARTQVGLAHADRIAGVAHIAARTAGQVLARRHGDGGGASADHATGIGRRDVAGQAPGTLDRVDHGQLVDLLEAGQAAQGHVLVEIKFVDAGDDVDIDFLRVDVVVAVIVAGFNARQRAVVIGIHVVRHAVLRRIFIALVQVAQGEAAVRTQAEGHRRGKAPTLEVFVVTAGHVVLVDHGIEAHGGAGFQVEIAVSGDTAEAVRAGANGDRVEVTLTCHLADQVDVASDRTRAREHRVGAVHQFNGFQIEVVGARVLRTVTHAVGGDVAVGAEAAQVDAVAITAAAFTRTESDAGQRAEHVTQANQALLVHHVLADHGDGLRRVEQGFSVFHRSGFLDARTLHFDSIQFGGALVGCSVGHGRCADGHQQG